MENLNAAKLFDANTMLMTIDKICMTVHAGHKVSKLIADRETICADITIQIIILHKIV